MKLKYLLSILTISILSSLIIAQGNITNIQINQSMHDFIAGNTIITSFNFHYPSLSPTYPNQTDNAPLVFVINITSNDSNYPVWKDDFSITGNMKTSTIPLVKTYLLECEDNEIEINYPSGPITIDNIPPGVFYCTGDDLLAMQQGSGNQVTLNIASNPLLVPGKYNIEINFFYPENMSQLPWDFNIYSPFNTVYRKHRVYFEIEIDKEVEEFLYIDYNDRKPKWRRLCRDCDEYGMSRRKSKSFDEGVNTMGLKAIDAFGESRLKNVSFIIDNKKPKIYRTYPRKNKFADGNFKVKFKEVNPINLFLKYGIGLYQREIKLDLNEDCYSEKEKTYCNTQTNLSEFDTQFIHYWFELTDIANRTVSSKKLGIQVDTTPPKILNNNSFYIQDRKYIYFDIKIDESNLDEVTYFYKDKRGKIKEKKLCSRLKKGKCEKRKRFNRGEELLNLFIIDEAGNYITKDIGLKIDY